MESTARSVLQDWNLGRIPYYTHPPQESIQNIQLQSSIVSEWSREFSLEEVVQVEGKELLDQIKSKSDFSYPLFSVTSGPVLDVDMDMCLPNDMIETMEE